MQNLGIMKFNTKNTIFLSLTVFLIFNPLSAKASGYLNITKNTTGNIDANFGYVITNSSSPTSSKITNISTANGTGSKQIELNQGTYTITENSIPGWKMVSASCRNNGDPVGPPIGTSKSNGVSGVTIEDGATITCTFENSPRAILKITKNTAAGDGVFSFNYNVNSNLSLAKTTITTSNGTGSTEVAIDPGKHTVTESDQVGWRLNSNSCSGPFTDDNSPTALEDDTTIGTAEWQNYSNAAASDNSYTKANLNDTNASQTYTISHYLKATNFGFNIPSNATIKGVEVKIERKASDLQNGNVVDNKISLVQSGRVGISNKAHLLEFWPGEDASVYYGSDTDLWGTTLTPADVDAVDFGVVISAGLVKSDNSTTGSATANIDNMTITVTYTTTVDVSDGQTLECVFENSRTSLKIVQSLGGLVGGTQINQSFTYFILPTPLTVNFPLSNNAGSTELFLSPGTYSIAQNVTSDWAFSASCDNGTGIQSGVGTLSNITLLNGRTTTCTFTNTKKGTLTISSDIPGSVFYIQPTPFIITNAQNSSIFLEAGNYSITESLPNGWGLLSSSCDNGDPSRFEISSGLPTTCNFHGTDHGTLKIVSNITEGYGEGYKITDLLSSPPIITYGPGFLNPGSYSIDQIHNYALTSASCDNGTPSRFNISFGQTTTCTFNYVPRGTLNIIVNNSGGDSSFIFHINPTPLTVTGGGSTSLDPGSYTIDEVVPTGWNLVSSSCENGGPSNFNIASNQTTTCTFNNSTTPPPPPPPAPLCPRLQCGNNGICSRCSDPAHCADDCQNTNGQCTPPPPSPNTYGSGSLKVIVDNPGVTNAPPIKVFDGRSSTGISVSSGSTITLPSMAAGSDYSYNYINYVIAEEINAGSNVVSMGITCNSPVNYNWNWCGTFQCLTGNSSGNTGVSFRISDGQMTTCTIKNYELGYINIITQTAGGDGEFRYSTIVSNDNPYFNPYPQFPYMRNNLYPASPSYPGGTYSDYSIETTNGSGSIKIPVIPGFKYYVSGSGGGLLRVIFDSASCSTGTPAENGVKDVIVSSGGQTVNCTFKYTYPEQPKLKIVTNTTGGEDTFTYNLNNNEKVNVKTVNGTGSSGLITVSPIGGGSIDIQDLPDGWKQDSFTCNQYTTTQHTPATMANENTGNYDGLGNYTKATNFGFNIPSNAVINSVNVNIKGNNTVLNSSGWSIVNHFDVRFIKFDVRFIKNGIIRPGLGTVGFLFLGPIYNLGPGDLRNISFSPVDINSSNFGIAIRLDPENSPAPPVIDRNDILVSITYTLPQSITSPSMPTNGISVAPGQTLTCYSNVSYDPDRDPNVNLGLKSSKTIKIFNNSTDKEVGDGIYNYNVSNTADSTNPSALIKVGTIKTINGSGSTQVDIKSVRDFFDASPTAYYSAYIHESAPSTWKLKNVSCMLSNATTHTPGTITDYSLVGSAEWKNPSDATYSDNIFATVNLNDRDNTSHYLKATNFGFNIPKDAVIKGIEVTVNKNGTLVNGGVIDNKISLVKDGNIQSTNRNNTTVWQGSYYNTIISTATVGGLIQTGYTTTAYPITSKYGAPDDLWGTDLTPTDVNSKDFGVAISAKLYSDNTIQNSAKASINQITLTITYETSGSLIDANSKVVACTFTNSPNICGTSSNEEGNRYKFLQELQPIGQ